MTMDSEVGEGSAVTAMEGTSKEGKAAGLDLRDALLLPRFSSAGDDPKGALVWTARDRRFITNECTLDQRLKGEA